MAGADEKDDRLEGEVNVLRPPPPIDEATVIQRAKDVIGDDEEALRWLGTPVRALGYETPISKLKDEAGAKEVMSVLGALEQGVW